MFIFFYILYQTIFFTNKNHNFGYTDDIRKTTIIIIFDGYFNRNIIVNQNKLIDI